MTRLPSLPTQYRKRPARRPAHKPAVQVSYETYQEIAAIRSAVSLIAARLTVARVEWAVEALAVEVARLEALCYNRGVETQGPDGVA